MFHSFVAFLATVYNASPFSSLQSDEHTMPNPFSDSSTSSQSNAFYRPSDSAEPIRNTRHRHLLLSTASTPNTPTLQRQPEFIEEQPQCTPEQEMNEETVLTDNNWLTNRRFVRGDRMERSGPRDNLMLLAAEEEEQSAERALQAATTEKNRQQPHHEQRIQLQQELHGQHEQQFQLPPQQLHEQQERQSQIPSPQELHGHLEPQSQSAQQELHEQHGPQSQIPQSQIPSQQFHEQQSQDGVAPQHQEQQQGRHQQQQQQETSSGAPEFHHRLRRAMTVAVTPHLESFITEATFVSSANISTASEDDSFVLRLPVRDARLAGQSVAEWAGSRKTEQRYAGSKRSFSDYLEDHDDCPEEYGTVDGARSQKKDNTDGTQWRDTQRNLEQMDDMYSTTFLAWILAEENALAIATYLKRLACEYPLERLVHVIKFVITDWRLQSIATLIKHVIEDWDSENGHLNVARLLREVTEGWEQMECVTSLVADVMACRNEPDDIKKSFLKALCESWDFSRISAFLVRLDNNIDHRIKCELLHIAAQSEQRKIELRMNHKRRRTLKHL